MRTECGGPEYRRAHRHVCRWAIPTKTGIDISRMSPINMKATPKNRILTEGGWVAAGQIINAVAALASIRIMTELLPPAQFGELTLLIGIAALAQGLASTPRLQAVFRYYPDYHTNGREEILRASASSLINKHVAVAALILGIGGVVLAFFTEQPWFIGALVAGSLIIDARRSFELAFLNAARRQRTAAIIQIADGWSRPLAALLSVLVFDNSTASALFGYLVGSTLVLILIRTKLPLSPLPSSEPNSSSYNSKLSDELSKSIRQYSLPLIPLAIFGWLNGMGDRYLIAGLLSVKDVGIYAAAYGLASKPFLMMMTIIEQTFRPYIHNAIANEDPNSITLIKWRMLLLIILSSSIGLLFFSTSSEIAAHIFFANEYQGAAQLMPWIALGYSFFAISSVYSRICYALDATKYVLALSIAGATIGIAVLFPIATVYGLTGAVIAVPLRFSVELILSALLARKAERMHHSFINKKTQ